MPGCASIYSNEKAYELVRQGATSMFYGPGHYKRLSQKCDQRGVKVDTAINTEEISQEIDETLINGPYSKQTEELLTKRH